MDVGAYLARIGAHRPAAADTAGLAALHRAHLRTVPFENLDIAAGVPISLELPDVYDKIVNRRRGGYCYENNALFGWLLAELGYPVTLLSARLLGSDGLPGVEYEHMRLAVEASGRLWLADVGNGVQLTEPLPHEPGEYPMDGRACAVRRSGVSWRTELRDGDGGWVPDWTWTLTPRSLEDFAERNRYQQISPESHFVQHRMCVLLTDAGRVALVDGVLSERVHGELVERRVPVESEPAVLRELFGIELAPARP